MASYTYMYIYVCTYIYTYIHIYTIKVTCTNTRRNEFSLNQAREAKVNDFNRLVVVLVQDAVAGL
jgi:hypothetical protein